METRSSQASATPVAGRIMITRMATTTTITVWMIRVPRAGGRKKCNLAFRLATDQNERGVR